MAPKTNPKTPPQPAADDVSLISELYEAIAASPPGIEERKLLVQLLMNCEWLDAARDAVSELLAIVPNDGNAQAWHKAMTKAPAEVVPTLAKPPAKSPVQITEIEEVNEACSQLENSYEKLSSKARMLQWEMTFLHETLQQKPQNDRASQKFFSTFPKNQRKVEALVGGRTGSLRDGQSKLGSSRNVTSQME
jgi:hypothetical protein